MLTASLTANWRSRLRHLVLCTAMLSIALPGLAAGKNAGARPAVQVNQNIESLLRRVEQKIYANHTMSPAGDSAVDAWMQVIQVIPATDSIRVGNALMAFANHMHSRADEEREAGNVVVSEDLSLFASVAEGQMAHMTAKTDLAEKHPSGEASSDPPKFEPLAGPMPPMVPPDVRVSEASAAPAASGANPTVLAANSVPVQPQGAVQGSVAGFYAARGDQMLAKKDVSAARKYYELAASAGSARAAMQLARINDPAFVVQSNAEPEARPQTHPHRRRVRATKESLGLGRLY